MHTHIYLWSLLSSKVRVLINGQTLDTNTRLIPNKIRNKAKRSLFQLAKTTRGTTINREKVKLVLFAGDTLYLENSESQIQNQLNERILLYDKI